MDARQPAPPPSTRPPDRPLAHNPNYQPPTTTPQAYAGYPPSTSQPQPQQLHVPFAVDPYATSRRDPFLPQGPQHARRSSHGMSASDSAPQAYMERQGGWANTARPNFGASHHHAQPAAPPPSMSSAATPSASSPYAYDAARRAQLNGAAPPNLAGAPSHDAPPPPSFTRPQMLPPSSPPQQQNHAPHAQRAPYMPSFGANRELPGLGPQHRPGSSMSISSLIGVGDTGAPAQTTQAQSSPPTNAQAANGHSMQPPSPRRSLLSGPRSDFALFRRQQSPERNMYGSNTSRALDGHGFTARSPSRAYSSLGSPEQQGRQSLPPSIQPYNPPGLPGQRLFPSSPSDMPGRDPRQPTGGIPPRPNSQPTGLPGPLEQDGRTLYSALGGRRSAYGAPEERRRTLGESHHSRPNTEELLGGLSHSTPVRDRANTVHPVSQSIFSPPRDQRTIAGLSDAPRDMWRHSAPNDTAREPSEARREEPPVLHRTYGPYPPPSLGPPRYSAQSVEDLLRERSLDHLNHRVVEQYHVPPTSDPNSTDRHKAEPLARSVSSGGNAYPGRPLYDHPQRMGEPMQLSKSHIGLGLEASRRTGRASPLPQAVQGAQAQPISIGKDPGIKREFGRMFSGLDSGLGSSTPSRGSPMPQNGQDSFDSNDMLRLQRVNSQQGRRPKRVKDEEVFDNDSADGRGMTSGVRGAKRNKYGHHHHHAPHHHHHHHHHHHRPDEEIPPSLSRQPSLQGGPGGPVHHHHHIQGAPHHHHHHHAAPRAGQQAPVPLPKISDKVHDIQPVLDEAAKHPRKHLGSHLYEAATELPKPNSSLDDQFGYASIPKRLPQFEINPINCTFTIRVPRFYLKPRQRQHIVLERHLWGARVYRDDSDPIAAAIHSGWIRGEWDDTVDISMLDPRITAPNDASDAQDILNKVPVAPVMPPADMDLQIEILILPRVQEYVGTVEFGISSRKSKTHEGLSFMINKIRWVEEGIGSRGQERTAAALKRRLDASATLLALQSGVDDIFKANGTAKLHA
ncbi:Rxt3-domain-containing protein [Dothidotthia symphoricarpi CBS 119687]|uniref:Rxt3-domain-containing protein n=1 Tax=Dothidotthia symphoricarpi CBS 119687 TaxID=1392245 RepID=A0A6A6AJ88_9PLEO|nr:Rxt3-domain-containing protein [Dothidotthia symphoricarpi CBS 119687]KAF2130974.1 Rxt3-domain-containing protein [Dothidotthia symphoricarpi CBS 119687]